MKKLLMLLPIIALFLVSACRNTPTNEESISPGPNEVTELERVELLLAAEGTAMYYAYVAQENGYFEDEGLEVELVPGNSGAFVVERIGNEKADIGIVAVPSLLPAWNQDIDIQVVYQINSTNLFDFILPKKSGIKNIGELKGQTVGVTDLGGAEVPMVRSILASAGLNPVQDVTLRPIGNDGTTILNAFEKGEIAAYSGGAHDLISLYATGFQSESLLPREYKTLPSTGIIANGKIIKERPDLVEKMARAIARGIDFSIKDRNTTFNIIKSASPKEYTDENVGKLFLDTFINLSAPIETQKGYGYIYRESWEKLVEQFSVGDDPVVSKEIDLDKYLNSSFLEKVNEFE